MRLLAITNQKGGVGKTTTSVNLAAALARLGRRVLLVDLDPQSHASLHVGFQLGSNDVSIYDVLCRGAALAEAARYVGDRLAVVPSSIDLVGAELELAQVPERERVLHHAFRAYHDEFDFCILDCAPSLGLLTLNALAAVDNVLIPLQAHFLALQGFGRLLETIALVRSEINPRLRVAGVVLCMFEKGTKLAQEVRDDVCTFLGSAGENDPWFAARVFDTAIRRNIKLAECPSFGRTIFDYAPTSHGAEDYLALAGEVEAAQAERVLRETGVLTPAAAAATPQKAAL